MKPLFTIHEGEFLVGEYISRKLKDRYDVYVPVKDRGIDLLVAHRRKRLPPLGIQVKFSRGFNDRHKTPDEFLTRGWYTLNPQKVRESPADLWVFAILTLRHEAYYVVIPHRELRKRVPRRSPGPWHVYITVYKEDRCYDTRGLKNTQVRRILDHGCNWPHRDYSDYLNEWNQLEEFSV